MYFLYVQCLQLSGSYCKYAHSIFVINVQCMNCYPRSVIIHVASVTFSFSKTNTCKISIAD